MYVRVTNILALGIVGKENTSSTLLGSLIGNLQIKLTKADYHEKKTFNCVWLHPGVHKETWFEGVATTGGLYTT